MKVHDTAKYDATIEDMITLKEVKGVLVLMPVMFTKLIFSIQKLLQINPIQQYAWGTSIIIMM